MLALACCGGRGYVATSSPQEKVLPLEVFGVSGDMASQRLDVTRYAIDGQCTWRAHR